MAWIKDLFCSSATLRLQSVPRFFSRARGDGAAALHGHHRDGDLLSSDVHALRRLVTGKRRPLRPSPSLFLTLRPKILILAAVTLEQHGGSSTSLPALQFPNITHHKP